MLPDFDPSQTRFTKENAYVLMRASQAAYATDDDSYFERLRELGIKRADQLWFSGGYDAGFLAWTSEFVILAFRGTDNPGGWVSNLYGAVPVRSKDYYGRIHSGFADAVNSLWNLFYPTLEGTLRGRPLFVTGHSRGGAVATLAAQSLVYERIIPRAVYTFGAPRVGNSGFAKKYDLAKNHFRVENDQDIVPHVPPWPAFRHVGQRFWLDPDGKLKEHGPNETPVSKVVIAALAMASKPDPTGAVALGGLAARSSLALEYFSDHANTEYAYWLWKLLPDKARADAGKSRYP